MVKTVSVADYIVGCQHPAEFGVTMAFNAGDIGYVMFTNIPADRQTI